MRRSRKPVWAVSSIEGSNPSLSAQSAGNCADMQAIPASALRPSEPPRSPIKTVQDRSRRGCFPTLFPQPGLALRLLTATQVGGRLRWPIEQSAASMASSNSVPVDRPGTWQPASGWGRIPRLSREVSAALGSGGVDYQEHPAADLLAVARGSPWPEPWPDVPVVATHSQPLTPLVGPPECELQAAA
jgi:hypothetical protein